MAVKASLDLGELSSLNYAHNRRLRWLALSALLAMVIGILYAIWRLVGLASSQPSQAITAVGGAGSGAVIAICGVIALSQGVRFLAPPPTSLEVTEDGLVLRRVGGSAWTVPWRGRPLEIQILDRSSDPKVPPRAQFRMWVRGTSADRLIPWRRVVPITYLSRDATYQIIKSAKNAGLEVREDPYFVPISSASMAPCRAFSIFSWS